MSDCSLECHPEKTHVVYCFDEDRQQDYRVTAFDFLGYSFRPRLVRSRRGRMFVSFTPAVSQKAKQRIRGVLSSLKLHHLTGYSIEDLATRLNPVLRGWIGYYGRFCKSELMKVLSQVNMKLLKWARKKYKRLKSSVLKADNWLKKVYASSPLLFVHWEHGRKP